MRLYKKGLSNYTADTVLFYVIFGVVLTVIMVGFMILIYNNIEDTTKIPNDIKEFLPIQRFFSESCFGTDDTNPQKTINWDRFDQETLYSCYSIDEESKKLAFTLEPQTPRNIPQIIKTNNWDENHGPNRIKVPINVTVHHNNRKIDGKLIISEQNA